MSALNHLAILAHTQAQDCQLSAALENICLFDKVNTNTLQHMFLQTQLLTSHAAIDIKPKSFIMNQRVSTPLK